MVKAFWSSWWDSQRHSNSEVDLPICTNMTHILYHYGKLPADRWSKDFFNFLTVTFVNITSCTWTGSSQGALQSAGMASYGIDRLKQKENCQRWKGFLWFDIVNKLDN